MLTTAFSWSPLATLWKRGLCRNALIAVLLCPLSTSGSDEKLYGGKTISAWQELIKTESLAELGQPDRVAGLLEIVQDTQAGWTQRRQAALTLGRIGAPAAAAVPVFMRLLNNNEKDSRTTRLWALRGLALLGPVAEESTLPVANIAADSRQPFVVQATALETLANVGQARAETLPVLLAAMKKSPGASETSLELRIVATEAIGLLGTHAATAIPDLIRVLEEEEPLLQRAAAHSLSRIGPRAEQAVPALLDVVTLSSGAESREAAAEALAALGPDGLKALEILSTDDDSFARRLGLRGLARAPASGEQLAIIRRMLSDSDAINRVEAAGILLNQTDQPAPALEVLLQGLSSSERVARISAYRFLQQHPEQLEALKPRLKDLAQDATAAVQTRDAARKLLQIAP